MENVKKGVQEFFNLPIEEKRKFGQIQGDVEGYGQLFVASEEQKLDWADMFFMIALPPHRRKPHLFPNIPLPFRLAFSLLSYVHMKPSYLLFLFWKLITERNKISLILLRSYIIKK